MAMVNMNTNLMKMVTGKPANVFRDVSPGSHIIYIKDINPDGCEEIMLTGVSVIDYPNFFTPNAVLSVIPGIL